MTSITIGHTADGRAIALPLRYGNRHGLITGATGTGKTVTLQRLAEEFSRAGVPVFAADVKGDLSGVAAASTAGGEKFPVRLWDLWNVKGMPIRTSIHEMGPLLLARMLRLNETQEGVLNIAFKWSPWDEPVPLRDLHDLRARLSMMLEHAETVRQHFGHVTGASISTIQRALLQLEAQGGHQLFGEPALDIEHFLQTDTAGRGVINLLHADNLMDSPRLYATFLLWLLSSLFNALPECGDLDKPKLVFFFDEAHLLFAEAPPRLMETIERVVRLIRSRGVGVYFVTQSPRDVPDTVQSQLGHRIQHALRVYTPRERKSLRAIVEGFRPNPTIDVAATVQTLGTGEALVSCLDGITGIPAMVERVKVVKPVSQIGPISDFERDAMLRADPMARRYRTLLSREGEYAAFVARMIATGAIEPPPPPTSAAPATAARVSLLQRLVARVTA